MKRIPSLALGILVGGAFLGSLSLLNAQSSAPVEKEPVVGRYMISSIEPSGVWFLDTATGDTWYRAINGQWDKKGNPVAGQN